jgi:RNA polymerase sigma factor (TIGR02999 family)
MNPLSSTRVHFASRKKERIVTAHQEVTKLLIHAGEGDKGAYEVLVLRVYDELRSLAGKYLRNERPDHTLQPTALVHEAYVRLVDQSQTHWKNRAQFFRVAARMMRRVLVDHARKHLAKKRGGGAERRSITQVADLGVQKDSDLIFIDEALEELAAFDPQKCKVVELRFFAGLPVEKVARVLDVSTRTVERDWSLARVWLFKKLGKGKKDGSGAVAED